MDAGLDLADGRGSSFAPAVVLRAAAWPIEKLTRFGDRQLAAQAAVAHECPDRTASFATAYDQAIEVERRLLWAETVENPEFLKALTLANPPLASRARELHGRAGSPKRIRRLERTLFRYLARAVGRTEPCDLWAGVALATWSRQTTVRRRPPRYHVSPDLRPFQRILRILGARPHYRRTSAWRANATVSRHDDGAWGFWVRLQEGGLVERRAAANEIADVLINALPAEPLALDLLAERLRAATGLRQQIISAALDAFVDAGVLVGGLDLPARFHDAWEALTLAGARLHGSDQRAWTRACAALRSHCRVLEDQLSELSAVEVAAVLSSSEQAIARLASDLGAGIDLPRAVLRCDLALPFDISLGAEFASGLDATLREYERLRDEPSPGRDVRRALATDVRNRLGDGLPINRVASVFATQRVGTATWNAAAEGDDRATRASTEHGPVVAPLGCLIAGLEESDVLGAQLAVQGVFDEVAPMCARYATLLEMADRDSWDALIRWLRNALDQLTARHDLEIAELAGPCELNPNALAGPRIRPRVVELWPATVRTPGLAGAHLHIDPRDGQLFVREAGQHRDTVLFSFASADIAHGDRVSELLLQTSFRQAPVPSFQASVLASAAELRGGRPTGPVRLPGGAAVRPRRTMLAGDQLAAVVEASGAERYTRWQRLASEHGWSALVRVRWEGRPAFLMPTASPLAVEAVFDGRPAGIAVLAVEEPGGRPWLTDDAGHHYTVEIALPFAREEHAWSRRGRAHNAADS